jgi:membrane fusion protein, multidrug efflux system
MLQTPQIETEQRGDALREVTERRGGANQRTKRGRRWLLFGIAGLVAAGIAASGIVDRQQNLSHLKTVAKQQALPKVALVSPEPGPKTQELLLPGDVAAWHQARIYAQVSGYVREWYKDYGAPVRKGELLAEISTPGLDQQLEQARSQLDVAQQKYSLAKLTAQRWQKLAGTSAVSQQTVDVYTADAAAQESQVQAAKFNVGRYEALEAFKRVEAPFDGIITARLTDIGAYVEATGGNAGQSGHMQELFAIADVNKLRIFVSVPQDYSEYIVPGLGATMTLPQFPGQIFHPTVDTTAHAFNESSRTVLVELQLDNPGRKILPGSYAELKFQVPIQEGILTIPEQSLLFRAQGLQVALVQDGKVHLQEVQVGLNLGEKVQVVSGLKPSDRLIANPSEGLLDGQAVQVVDAPPQNSGLSDKVSEGGQQETDE